MTDLCNEQYSIFVQIIGGHDPPTPPPPPPIPTALKYNYGALSDLSLYFSEPVRDLLKDSKAMERSGFGQSLAHSFSLPSLVEGSEPISEAEEFVEV